MDSLVSNPSVSLFEVDTSASQEKKLAALAEAGLAQDGRVTYVAADFAKAGEWVDALANAGCSPDLPTCLLWEGVTMYLSREDVSRTLSDFKKRFVPGSVIGFDYFATEHVNLAFAKRTSRNSGEPLDFSLPCPLGAGDNAVRELFGDGLRVAEHISLEELAERYAPRKPDGSMFGYANEKYSGGFALAEKE